MHARRGWILLGLLAVWSSSRAQSPTPEAPAEVQSGKTSVDAILVDGVSPNVPLRNAKVIPGSESVTLDGRPLKKDRDYLIDYDRGLIYLTRSFRKGQSVHAVYRFDPARKDASGPVGNGFGGMTGMALNFAGGQQKLYLGLGLAERMGDGTVVTSNVYGFKNRFAFKGGAMSGITVVGDQRKVQSSSLLDGETKSAAPLEGKSQAIVQGIEVGSEANGKAFVNIQDISKNFAGFQAFRDAGYDEATIGALAKERGLKRASYGFSNLGSGLTRFNALVRTVKDGDNSIEWKSAGFTSGPVKAEWESSRVSKDFKRFDDLNEGDRGQLKQEGGTKRERWKFGYADKGTSASYESTRIGTESDGSVSRRTAGLTTNWLKFGWYDQSVDKTFTRFNATRLADAGQLAREQGLKRTGFSVESQKALGKFQVAFSQSNIRSGKETTTQFSSTDLRVGTDRFSYERHSRGSESGFQSLGAMSEGEIKVNVEAIGAMSARQAIPFRGEDRNAFVQNPGLQRDGQRVQLNPGKGLSLVADTASVSDATGGASQRTIGFDSKNLSLAWRKVGVDSAFGGMGGLMPLERERYGGLNAFNREDIGLNWQFNKSRKFGFSSVKGDREGEGEISRQVWFWQDPNLQVNYTRRSVANSFSSFGGFMDYERDLLTSLRGFRQSDFTLQWRMMRGLEVSSKQNVADQTETGESRVLRENNIAYQVDKDTKLNYYEFKNKQSVPFDLLYLNSVARWTLWHNFGRGGNLKYEQEKIEFDGSTTEAPNSQRSTIAYEAKLNPKTSVSTEHTEVKYDNGDSDKMQTHSISTELSKRTGVTLTESSVQRSGERPDERRHSYGFWWDFGGGMRLSYNTARQSASNVNGAEQSSLTLTPGQIGGIAVGSASYAENNIDRTRYQRTGNVQLSTAKPLQLGVVRNFTFRYGADTFRDQYRYQRENHVMGAGFTIWGAQLGWDYLSQVGANGELAIDRSFRISTDNNPKRKLSFSVNYKLRTLPGEKQFMIRNYQISAKPIKNWEITHQLQTNPEVARGDVILGSVPQASRANRWKLEYKGNGATTVGASWDEYIDDNQKSRSRTAGVSFSFFNDKGSPLSLFYGLEQNSKDTTRRTQHRYSLRFDQKPGPNQLLSLFVGNVSWQHSRDAGVRIQNWSLRIEYQLRF